MTNNVENVFCPLVSVAVITYNSCATVIETLDSIKRQTYKNIELIISDDASVDNTIELCRSWLEKNEQRFSGAQIISAPQNTGVSANMNRAEKACNGIWIKGIAGDDILFDDCIESNISFVNKVPTAKFVFSRIWAFGSNKEACEYWNNNNVSYSYLSCSGEDQLEYLLFKGNFLPAPSFFYHRETMQQYQVSNDERIPLLEDYPKWIRLLRKGGHFSFLDRYTVYYRTHSNSLSTGPCSSAFEQSLQLFFIYYLFWPRFRRNPSFSLVCQYLNARIFTKRIGVLTILFWTVNKVIGVVRSVVSGKRN